MCNEKFNGKVAGIFFVSCEFTIESPSMSIFDKVIWVRMCE